MICLGNHHIRRCYSESGNVELAARRYKCRIREEAKEKLYCFSGIDDEVIATSPPYVAAYWRQHGFSLTKNGGTSWKIMDRTRRGGRNLAAGGAGNGCSRGKQLLPVNGTKRRQRCKTCGHWINGEYAEMHKSEKIPTGRGKYLRADEVCSVPEGNYHPDREKRLRDVDRTTVR